MKKTILILCILLSLIISVSHGTEDTILALDDNTSYTLEEINSYIYLLNVQIPPFKQTDIHSKDNKINTLVERYIRSLAFRTRFVEEEIEKSEGTPEIDLLVRDQLRNYMYQSFMKKLALDSRPTTPELEMAYEKQKDKFKVEERRKIAVLYKVFPDDRDLHDSLIRTLKKIREKPDINENFTSYVKEYSDLPGAMNGGIVDYFSRGKYGPIFEKYAFSTPKGEISPVFTASKGAYIIKCLDVKPAGYLSLSEAAQELGKPIYDKKIERAQKDLREKLKKDNSLWVMENIPQKGTGDLVLLKVNDYNLTSGTLFRTYPVLGRDISDTKTYLQDTAEKEALFQEFEQQWRQNPSLPLGREVKILRINAYHEFFFSRLCEKEIQVRDEEAREYYEKYREYYHRPTPKRLAYLLFKKPTDPNLSEPQFYKKIEWQQRDIRSFWDKVKNNPDSFIEEAKGLAKSRGDALYEETDWVEAIPPGWNSNKSIINYTVGNISSVLLSDRGFLVFKVIDQKKPEILSYEEVKKKVYSVIWSMKQKALIEKTRDQILTKYHFQLNF